MADETWKELVCTARVRVVIEVGLTQPWVATTTVEEAHRVAERQALEHISRLHGHPFSVVGKPFVEVVSTRKAPRE